MFVTIASLHLKCSVSKIKVRLRDVAFVTTTCTLSCDKVPVVVTKATSHIHASVAQLVEQLIRNQ